MDAKVTLSFDKSVLASAKAYAESRHISLSRLTELLFRKLTAKNYDTLEELPVADWVNILAEGDVQYKRAAKSRKEMKKEFYESKK
jgi:hypothetical protein